MRRYTVQVRMTYVHTIDVEAETQDAAEIEAFESFDLSKAYQGEGECWTCAIDGEER
jgi:hypothetical protein